MKLLKEVDQYIDQAPDNQSVILRKLRTLIQEVVPSVEEQFKWGQPVYATEQSFAYLKSNKSHVNLGFYDYNLITDSDNLLEGTGKKLRHIKIKNLEDFNIDTLKEMIKQSSKTAK